ncbi:hypothetical protein DPMN_052545 [Dreissena polymorpha]|uniref:Uncharacterized protein n=1 Tax=Dreissena polymorpha TaxID=45954 RepID=A0A9D4CL32_DREPO|nr:hypothetical protein DPMN_052545 [Dreissena polymorpha]
MRRQYRRKRKRIYAEPEESCAISLVLAHSSSNTQLTVTTDMTKLINETEKHHSPEQLNKETDIGRAPPVTPPSDNNDADSIKEARSEPRGNSTTDIVDQPGASGSPEPHDGQCHDGRLCSVSPQSKDHGKLCTNSSYFKYPTETNG